MQHVWPVLNNAATINLPLDLSAELLGRKPDMAARRTRIEATEQGLKSAKADFYPNINLTAFVELSSLTNTEFLKAASRTAGLGHAISLPILMVVC